MSSLADLEAEVGIPQFVKASVGLPVREIKPLSDGANSRAYRVTVSDGKKFCVKKYPSRDIDRRNRLEVEFSALRFLRNQGEACVPAPIARDDARNLAIFEWIDGRKNLAPEKTAVDLAIKFLRRLQVYRDEALTEGIPDASDACFSGLDMAEQIRGRFDSLMKFAAGNAQLGGFLQKFSSCFARVLDDVRLRAERNGLEFDVPLGPEFRVLSPSDFGFHNILIEKERCVFLDFEYFGWDDPAKLLLDFYWHPGMLLSDSLRKYFVSEAASLYDAAVCSRIEAFSPLFGLNWCLIMLNVFRTSQNEKDNSSGEKKKQLKKARNYLVRVEEFYKDSEYAK